MRSSSCTKKKQIQHVINMLPGDKRGWFYLQLLSFDRTRGMVLKWDRGGLGWILGGSFSPRGWWRTEQVAQGGCGCPIPAGIQGQAGCGSGQPGLLVGDSAHSRGLELDEHCGSLQPRPFCDPKSSHHNSAFTSAMDPLHWWFLIKGQFSSIQCDQTEQYRTPCWVQGTGLSSSTV